jgi:hypothetical protein
MPRLVQPLLKAAIVTALVAGAFAGAAVHAPRAQAAIPCWKVLLNDWYDGRIDHVYPVHCYRDALKHLPTDVSTYSSAHDDILRALQSAIAAEQKQHKTVSANTPIPPENKGPNDGAGAAGASGPPSGGSGEPGRDPGAGLASEVSSSSPSSVPTPLIILGALALVLVAAGGAGLLAKRIQARRQSGT